MSDHAWVLMIHYKKGLGEECRILDLYYNEHEGKAIRDEINKNYYAEGYEHDCNFDMYPGAPKASLIKRRLKGENFKLLSIFNKLDKISDELDIQIYNVRRHAKNKRRSKKEELLDQIWGH